MLQASQFFRDNGGEELLEATTTVTLSQHPCRFERISASSWRLQRQNSNQRSSHEQSPIPHSAVIHSMNQFLTQQSSTNTTRSRSSHQQPQTVVPSDQDLWVLDVENYLTSQQHSDDNASKNMNYQDRDGVLLSSPLRLCRKTITKSRLQPNTQNGTASTEGRNIEGNSSKFSLQSLATGGETSQTMKFNCYQEKRLAENTSTEVYIPPGYEELENGKSRNGQSAAPKIFYAMEVKNCEAESFPVLEDIAIIWGNNSSSSSSSSSKGNDEEIKNMGVQVKLMSTKTFQDIISYSSSTDTNNEHWANNILLQLEHTPGLSLPQMLGTSLIIIVSFSPNDATYLNRLESDRRKRLLAQLEKSVQSGHFVLRFQRNEFVRHPLSSRISTTHFCIGRRIQITNHSESEEEETQKLLDNALSNAERFVPAWKQQQWDSIPDALLMVYPHPGVQHDIRHWLLDPVMRRSNFDLALGNVLLFQHYWQQFTSPVCHYVDRFALNGPVGNDISYVQNCIVQKVEATKTLAATFEQQRKVQDNNIVDARQLENLCTEMEERSSQDSIEDFVPYMATKLQQYLRRTIAATELERLRCFQDMKKHDMYSILRNKHQVEIPPPMVGKAGCSECFPGQPTKSGLLCPYHLAASTRNIKIYPGKPIPIRTKEQLEFFPTILRAMGPHDSIVIKITVPGVAESYPLLTVGDFVRLVFRGGSHEARGRELVTEVIGEIADVVIKTEEVTLRLPSPFQYVWNPRKGPHQELTTYNCFPYLQALLYIEDFWIDATPIMNALPHLPPQKKGTANKIPEDSRNNVLNRFRFDVRFGFLGGRGFDIINRSFTEATMAPVSGSYGYHLSRCLAPIRAHLNWHSNKNAAVYCFQNPLNLEQRKAVMDIVCNKNGSAPYVIEGPAGTGKSMCVCEAVVQVLRAQPGAKILVCAPSDAACDVLATRLLPFLPEKTPAQARNNIGPLVRINWWSRKRDSLPPTLLSVSPMDSGGLFTLPSWAALQSTSIIVCQCLVAEFLNLVGPRGWTKSHFSHLFIDETSQAMECEALVPILLVGQQCSLVLAGDPKQLGPTIREPTAARAGLGMSIQERLLKLPLYKSGNINVMTRLVANYRSNEALLTVPSKLFYEGSLQSLAPKEVADPFEDFGDLGPKGFPLLLCNVRDGKERNKLDTPSFFNMEECDAILALVKGLLNCKTKEGIPKLHTGQIAVITPFRAQVLALRTVLRSANLGGVNVGVVEDFQGQEQKVVLISTVLTRDHDRWNRQSAGGFHQANNGSKESVQGRLGFMHDPKRFNVAITRAHALCVIVGNAEYLESSGTYWTALIEHIRRNNGIVGEDRYDDEQGNTDDEDIYGVDDLLRRVEELRLLGSGFEDDMYDLSFYCSDAPQWKVMLS